MLEKVEVSGVVLGYWNSRNIQEMKIAHSSLYIVVSFLPYVKIIVHISILCYIISYLYHKESFASLLGEEKSKVAKDS